MSSPCEIPCIMLTIAFRAATTPWSIIPVRWGESLASRDAHAVTSPFWMALNAPRSSSPRMNSPVPSAIFPPVWP